MTSTSIFSDLDRDEPDAGDKRGSHAKIQKVKDLLKVHLPTIILRIIVPTLLAAASLHIERLKWRADRENRRGCER
jgi:hypothetical protein